MKVRTFVAPIATLMALGGVAALPAPTHAVTSVTVKVFGSQTYGGTTNFVGTTGTAGVTVSGITCTGLTGGAAIAPTLTAGGTYTIDGATCSGGVLNNPNYVIGSYSGQKLTVNKATIGVTADNASRAYKDDNPTFTFSATGLKNGEDTSVLTGAPTITTDAKSSSVPGDYAIKIFRGTLGGGDNYTINSFTDGTLTITAKPITVSVTGIQVYGGTPVWTASTGIAGLSVSGLGCTKLNDGRDVAPTLGVGNTYVLDTTTCSATLSSDYYTIAGFTSNRFVVQRAELTVTADSKSRIYGFNNPALTYTVTGLQNGETTAALNGAPDVTTTAVVKSNVGDYPIEVKTGTLSSPNYRFTLVDGTLTINKRLLTVTANPATRGFRAADPAYTATITGFRNGDTIDVVTGAPAFSTTATVDSSPGVYPLSVAVGTLDATNYGFTGFVGSTLTISEAPAIITTKKMKLGVIEATVTYGATNTPVVGSTITFTVGSSEDVACTAVTDATGRAACTVSGSIRTGISLRGYTAHFPGSPGVLAGEQHQGIF
ncbi:hypothetical protein F0U44_18670 [Nocardioides humilatus]|uniref:MBG domain-containing protein n=1 Tax=Nocardioides humilatus TaxID=2607660 RepID=A0A5B1L9K6_9ACTN|nr:MBG domain-containing protein [Nocardioides humilatus]KAA1416347.1 hypothetical protein F0U44_18670 [Nocardioides humilatus]